LALWQGSYGEARLYLEESLALSQSLGKMHFFRKPQRAC
jgi:hypothetical protein